MGNSVLVVLSVGGMFSPVLFGYTLWKMSQVFVSRLEFGEYKKMADERRGEINTQLSTIQLNVIELLRRSAAMEAILQERYPRAS